jgi:L-proline amide hydrolase
MSPKPTSEGTIPFLVPAAGKEVVTYYKIFGDIKEPGKVPCVLLHGGPGLSHDYMLSCVPLYTQFGIPLILYDQIGNGLSTHLPEKKGDEEFFTEELFHHELSNLISHLKLDSTGYDILGHSWGGMMGSTFAGKQPKGLKRLVISNSSASIKSWIEANNEYRRRLPQEMQDTLQKHEDAGTTESKEYEGVMDEFYRRHMCYVTPPPAEFARTLEWIGKDSTVAMTMYAFRSDLFVCNSFLLGAIISD